MTDQRITRTCRECGGLFSPIPSEVRRGGGWFCTWKCYTDWRTVPLAERFQRYLSAPTAKGCVLWTGAIGPPPNCYGSIAEGGRARRQLRAHRVALELTGQVIPAGFDVLHHCDVKFCVNPAHLYVGTDADNARDRVVRNLSPKGERNAAAKLTAPEVREIRLRHQIGNITQKSLAAEYRISTTQMSSIILRRTWRHVAD